MDNYVQQVKESNTLTLRAMLSKMPYFCTDFFRGIVNSTESRTQVAYCRDIYHFLYFIKTHNPIYTDVEIKNLPFDLLELITPADIDEYLDYLTLYKIDGTVYKNENASKARKLSSLSKLYDFYIKREQLKNNPIAAVERPKVKEKAIITLDQDQIHALLNLVDNPTGLSNRQLKYHEMTATRDRAILVLLLGTGLRVSELVGLDIGDVDFEQRSLRVMRKGGKEAFVYFGEDVSSTLSSYLLSSYEGDEKESGHAMPSYRDTLLKENPDTPALFVSLKGTRLTVRSVENIVKKYTTMLATNKKITPHKLRSTYGTEIYSQTGDIYLTAELLGHKDINTTKKHYASMDQDRLKAAADILKFNSGN